MATSFVRGCWFRTISRWTIGCFTRVVYDIGLQLVARYHFTDFPLFCLLYPGPEGAGYTARLLKENFYITELDLGQNKIKSPGAQAIAEVLIDNNTIKTLNLSWNDFKDKDAECLAEGIRVNQTLVWLDLSHNGFAEEAGLLFGENRVNVLNEVSGRALT